MSTSQRVFVSYQRSDEPFARRVREHLVAAGVQTWMDAFDIPVGAYWPDEIDKGLAAADIVVGVLSPDAVKSRNVKNEWDWAIQNDRRLLLLQSRPCVIPHRYVSINFIDATADPAMALDALLQTLGVGVAPAPAASPAPTRHGARRAARQFPVAPVVVGREREQELLRGLLDDALAGRGRVALVSGEAGIGKTTITSWLGWAAEEAGAVALSGACYDLSTTRPYGPWVALFRAWPDGLPQLPDALREGGELGSVSSQAALFDLIEDTLTRAAEARPLLLLLEDLHWADQATLDLLRHLARPAGGARLLLVVTYRDDELTRRHPLFQLLPGLAREPASRRVTLQRLDAGATRELVASRYPLPAGDAERLVGYVQQLTEGNPFFAGEVLSALEEAGALARAADGWRVERLERVQVPALVRGVIERRLEHLGDDARRALEIAAVIGHEVPLDLWVAVSGLDDAALSEALERATEARLVEELPAGFRFTHALIRETLYDGLVLLRRRGWHRAVAERLEAGTSPDADTVAHHFQQAHDPRAFEWLIRAAERAVRTMAWVTAVQRYESALALLPADGADRERAHIVLQMATLSRTVGPLQALRYADEALRLARSAADPVLIAAALQVQGLLHTFAGNAGDSIDVYERAVQAAQGLGAREFVQLVSEVQPLIGATAQSIDLEQLQSVMDELSVDASIAIQNMLSFQYGNVGRFDEALALAETTLAFMDRAVERGVPERLLLYLGYGGPWTQFGVHLAAGRLDAALDAARSARDAGRRIGDLVVLISSLARELNEIVLRYETDNLQRRQGLVEQIRTEYPRMQASGVVDVGAFLVNERLLAGDWTDVTEAALQAVSTTAGGIWNIDSRRALAELARYQGRYDEVAPWLRGIAPGSPSENPGRLPLNRAMDGQRLLAELALDRGELELARAWLEAHDRWLAQTGVVFGRAGGALIWSRYYQLAGDTAAALRAAQESLRLAGGPRQPLGLLRAQRQLGELLTTTGSHTDAEQHLRRSLSLAGACAAPFERALTLLALAELRAAQQNVADARSLLAEVRAICEPLDARPGLQRVAALEARLNPNP
jgi:tetratricopeptide (TPR) repeat protein